ncbi:hypothetical protein ABZX92_31190 [Lentzea sp. NPDC006480]|uniref:hypothetical protein n=1 Tax=Lentzea sp. NPDC006480 TaxID=3157176 RepID=UPI00339FADEB
MVFECSSCGAALTVALTRIALPEHAGHAVGNGFMELPVLLPPGTYATGDGRIAVAPGDVRGLSWIPGRLGGHCCGLDGRDGPNLACACGQQVAARVDDCSLWQAVWFERDAVRPVGEPEPVADWEAFDWESTPRPVADEWWQDRVEIAAGVALARILAASGGMPVIAADGPVADTFQRRLDEMLMPGPVARSLAAAGPGLPVEADIALVPRHPQTGEPWPAAGTLVPISAELWTWLVRDHEQPVIPPTGGRWHPHFADDPLPTRPKSVAPSYWAMRREQQHLG